MKATDEPTPETLRTLDELLYAGTMLAGSHLEFFQPDADPDAGEVGATRKRFEDLLPKIEADTREMLAVFS